MPSCAQHMDKVRSNLGFVALLLKTGVRFLDWVITAYFYSAVHLAEAYFDRFAGKHYGNHPNRRAAIALDKNISHLYGSYRQLETYSRVSRYGIKQFDMKYVNRRVKPQFQKFSSGIETLHQDLHI